ncbi:MAG: S-layer homology domain-containing protein [Clostridia bacterium]|nr:S-layer homology domain-containing protein [Clostridia bacterium]
MKRHVLLLSILILALVFSTLVAIPASAYLGQAAAVLAEDITLIKTGLLGEKLVFRDTDFKEALGVPSFKSITIRSLPSSTDGTLFLNGRRVGVDQTIKRKNIGALVFIPTSAQTTSCTFTFTVDGYGGGEPLTCQLKFIDKINYAPKAADSAGASVSVWTQSGISVYGQMSGSDPEGDELEFIVLAYPKGGTLTVSDKTTGAYRYTPKETYVGTDSFSYVVRDTYGNFSEIATVSLSISNRVSDVTFVDMQDRAEHNAALVLSASGVFSGTMVGDDMYFRPEDTVTRAEFVAMALKTYGIRADSTLTATYFDDNDAIPTSLVGYVATAQKLGLIHGSFDGESLNFRPNEPITLCEAAMVLSSLIGDDIDSAVSTINDVSIPVWARPGVSIMYDTGIYDESCSIEMLNTALTRATAASVLFRMASLS